MGVGVWKAGSFIFNYADRSTRYDKLIVNAGRRNGVYPPLLKAVIWKESRFDASAMICEVYEEEIKSADGGSTEAVAGWLASLE